MKSEPSECSFEDVWRSPKRTTPWTGVRNYQARNFMRDDMRRGDGVLFYHSSCAAPGIAGIAEVASTARTDDTQFDPDSPYYDPKATPVAPRWCVVDVRALRRTRLVSITELRDHRALRDLWVLRRGNRLSITPVTPAQWKYIVDEVIGS